MNCKHVQHKLTGGAALSAEETSHLESCGACGRVAEQQRLVSRSLEMVAVAEPPIGSADRAFRAAMSGESVIATPTFLDRLFPVVGPMAAVSAAAAVIALLLGSPSPSVDPDSDAVSAGLFAEDDDADEDVSDLLALGDDQ